MSNQIDKPEIEKATPHIIVEITEYDPTLF